MPNHVRNVLKFKKLKPEDIDIIINMITTKYEYSPDAHHIDFNKIIPEPKEKSECPEDCLRDDKDCVEADKDRPWFDWYTWHNEYWGTKWNAYDSYTIVNKSSIIFVFSTAWSMPYPVIRQLELLGYEFELKYADEDYGSNCGILTYEQNEDLGEKSFFHQDESALKNPRQWARNLWDKY